LIQEDLFVYGLLGLLRTDFSLKQTNTYAGTLNAAGWNSQGSGRKKISLWGAEIGIGAQYAMAKDWHLGLEYSYQMYSTLSYDFFPINAQGNSLQTTMRPRFHKVALTLSYKL